MTGTSSRLCYPGASIGASNPRGDGMTVIVTRTVRDAGRPPAPSRTAVGNVDVPSGSFALVLDGGTA